MMYKSAHVGPRGTMVSVISMVPFVHPFAAYAALPPQGSVSLDSRVASLPYESSSLATSKGNENVTELA